MHRHMDLRPLVAGAHKPAITTPMAAIVEREVVVKEKAPKDQLNLGLDLHGAA